MRGIGAALALGLQFAWLGGCAAEDVSPEARVRAFFDEVERASSEKDLKALKAIVSERYKDAAASTYSLYPPRPYRRPALHAELNPPRYSPPYRQHPGQRQGASGIPQAGVRAPRPRRIPS